MTTNKIMRRWKFVYLFLRFRAGQLIQFGRNEIFRVDRLRYKLGVIFRQGRTIMEVSMYTQSCTRP